MKVPVVRLIAGFAAVSVLVAVLHGCATPSVRYERLDPPNPGVEPRADTAGKTKFKLASSLVLVEVRKVAAGDLTVAFTSTPVEERNNRVFAVREANMPGIKTNLGVQLFDNTRLIKAVSTNLEDQRVQLLKEIGSVVATVVGFGAAASPGKLPDGFRGTVDFARLFLAVSDRGAIVLEGDALANALGSATIGTPTTGTGAVTRIEVDALSADATPTDSYPLADAQPALIHSACRKATIEVEIASTVFSGTVVVADPNFVATVGLPNVGSVTMHSSCGASVVAGKSDTASVFQLLDTAIQQAKAVRDAQQKKNGG